MQKMWMEETSEHEVWGRGEEKSANSEGKQEKKPDLQTEEYTSSRTHCVCILNRINGAFSLAAESSRLWNVLYCQIKCLCATKHRYFVFG